MKTQIDILKSEQLLLKKLIETSFVFQPLNL